MKKLIIPILLLASLSCQSNEQKNDNSTPPQQQTETSTTPVENTTTSTVQNTSQDGQVKLEPFTIKLNLSNELKEKLASSGETVIFSVSITTSAELTKDQEKALKEYFDEKHSGIFADAEKESKNGESVVFDNIMIDKKVLDVLGEQNINVDVNIYSGRKVFQN